MSRRSEVWVYPEKGEPYLKGSRPEGDDPRGPLVMGDLPDFVSPIDGKLYSGRAGMRNHNAQHNVVPTADLAGLPVLDARNSSTRDPYQVARDRAARKEQVIQQVNKHYR